MGKNLATKVAIIIAVLLFFVYGIIGIPHSTGKGLGDSLKQSLADRIHLGLDLKGGTHLVLQVHVAEAVASATDRDVARIETALRAGRGDGRDGGEDGCGASGDDHGSGVPPAQTGAGADAAAGQRLLGL